MSAIEMIKEKGAEVVGKVGIATGVTSEAAKAAGFMDNVTPIQVISAAGVVTLMLERSLKIYWKSKEKGNTKMVVIGIAFFWCLFFVALWAVL